MNLMEIAWPVEKSRSQDYREKSDAGRRREQGRKIALPCSYRYETPSIASTNDPFG